LDIYKPENGGRRLILCVEIRAGIAEFAEQIFCVAIWERKK